MPQCGKLSSARNPAAPRLLSAGVKSSSFEVSPFLRPLRLREKAFGGALVGRGSSREPSSEIFDVGLSLFMCNRKAKTGGEMDSDVRSFTSKLFHTRTYKLISGACFPVPFVREAVRARPSYPGSGQQEDNMKSLKPEI